MSIQCEDTILEPGVSLFSYCKLQVVSPGQAIALVEQDVGEAAAMMSGTPSLLKHV